jgi:hypothetical protein
MDRLVKLFQELWPWDHFSASNMHPTYTIGEW